MKLIKDPKYNQIDKKLKSFINLRYRNKEIFSLIQNMLEGCRITQDKELNG